MRLDLIAHLCCPYCGGGFSLSHEAARQGSHVEYGLLTCRCFAFPVVDGVLMLSLSKAYGGAEENLQPYASLQIAAIQYLERGDLPGLKGWMSRHLPLGVKLIEGRFKTYLEFAAAYEADLDVQTQRFLIDASEDEVTGDLVGRESVARRLGPIANLSGVVTAAMHARLALRRRRDRSRDAGDLLEGRQIRDSYYAQRFFSPRLSSTHLNRRHLGTGGRVLSLCPGHGVFEFSLQLADARPATLVSMDAQFINLLVLKHLLHVDGSLICHDVQFRFPFVDGWFDGVFSSTCLPEVPAQRQFVCEAIRVTRPSGWTLFDSIWALDSGVKRIDPRRHYRFCQNFFRGISDYVPFFRECAGQTRKAYFDISGSPGDYLGGPPWLADAEADAAFVNPRDEVMSVLVLEPTSFEGYRPVSSPDWLNADVLSISPAYRVERNGEALTLTRKREFAHPQIYFQARKSVGLPQQVDVPIASLRDAARITSLYTSGVAVALPDNLLQQSQRLAGFLSPLRS